MLRTYDAFFLSLVSVDIGRDRRKPAVGAKAHGKVE